MVLSLPSRCSATARACWALPCLLLWACGSLLDSPNARYVERSPDDAAEPEDARVSHEAGLDASTALDAAALDASAARDAAADASRDPNPGGCSADRECPSDPDNCVIGSCQRELASCSTATAPDCSNCGLSGLCVLGTCREDGHIFASGLEDDRLGSPWSTHPSRPWAPTDENWRSGQRSLKSGRISNNSGSLLELTVVGVPDRAVITFWLRVSSELGYDLLKFSIDDVFVQAWSGNQDWQLISYDVGASGTVKFSWDYVKDNGDAFGDDAAYIDEVVVKRSCP